MGAEGGECERALDDGELGNGTIILRKAICENTLQKKLKFTKVYKNKFGQVVETSSDLILCLSGFVKATKFRDSCEFSECVKNVLAKSCLPCQCLYVNQNNIFAEREKA